MAGKKVVIIGAGSLAFTPYILSEIVSSEEMKGFTVGLVDLDASKLDVMRKLADKMVYEKKAEVEVQSTVDRREALKGADFVFTTIAVGGVDAQTFDASIPMKHDISQTVADTVGPGGFSRALRHIPPMVDICRDIEKICPNAILFNETNPMTCICSAIRRLTKVNVIGLCHGIVGTKAFLARFLGAKPEEAEVCATGINHLTWILDFRICGEDAYPLLKERRQSQRMDVGAIRGYAISFKLFEIYGVFPSPGDTHIAEFYPYFLTRETGYGERYGLTPYPRSTIYDPAWRAAAWERVLNWAKPSTSLDELFKRKAPGERSIGIDIIATLTRKRNKLFEAVNIPNAGFVTNLPKGAIVEVPALIGPPGVKGIYVGDLPKGVAATIRHRLIQQELTVDAALTGDRKTALQALVADPMVTSIEVAETLLGELLKAHAPNLPQFFT